MNSEARLSVVSERWENGCWISFFFFFLNLGRKETMKYLREWETIFLVSPKIAKEGILHLSSDPKEKQCLSNTETRHEYYYSCSCSRSRGEMCVPCKVPLALLPPHVFLLPSDWDLIRVY